MRIGENVRQRIYFGKSPKAFTQLYGSLSAQLSARLATVVREPFRRRTATTRLLRVFKELIHANR
jgi:hypothetical protein